MAYPSSTFIWPDAMDPADIIDYKIDCSAIMDTEENIASYSLVLMSESLLAGLNLGTGVFSPYVQGKFIYVWFNVTTGQQAAVAFTDGLTLPMELTLVTDSVPPRTRQRTLAIRIINK